MRHSRAIEFSTRVLKVAFYSGVAWYLGSFVVAAGHATVSSIGPHSSWVATLFWPPFFAKYAESESTLYIIVLAELPFLAAIAALLPVRTGYRVLAVLLSMAATRIPNLMTEFSTQWAFAFIAIGGAALPVSLEIYRVTRWHQRRLRKLCLKCGYDVRLLSTGRCPECGHLFETLKNVELTNDDDVVSRSVE